MCHWCKRESVSQYHMLLLCPLAVSIWSYFNSTQQINKGTTNTVKLKLMQWWIGVSGKSMDSVYTAILYGVVAWHLWKTYWDSIFNESVPDKGSIIHQICKLMLNWCGAHDNLHGNERIKGLGLIPLAFKKKRPQMFRWIKPIGPRVKLNWCVFKHNGKSAVGYLLLDHVGKMIASEGFPLSGLTMGEDEVFHQALKWTEGLGFPN
ncbi:unnamed protein product [Cuscuta epithymum]|uniref:Reverse transcriptase zinc-binding domain-containing protein n=1 Tax=Cuscuta epithymum TaxID=186058 RepID=A0AAV0CAI7_9ASTE|nr:unnamed protein product [Cuscuta epithymum]